MCLLRPFQNSNIEGSVTRSSKEMFIRKKAKDGVNILAEDIYSKLHIFRLHKESPKFSNSKQREKWAKKMTKEDT